MRFLTITLLLAAACSGGSSSTSPSSVSTTTVTLGPTAAIGSSYQPSGLPANWSGYCPVPTPSSITLVAGNAYQVVNKGDRSIDLVTLPTKTVFETIAAGATGTKHIEYGAVSQSTFSFTVSVAGCTDGASGQGLFTVTVNSK